MGNDSRIQHMSLDLDGGKLVLKPYLHKTRQTELVKNMVLVELKNHAKLITFTIFVSLLPKFFYM